jgi:hypothetical protein
VTKSRPKTVQISGEMLRQGPQSDESRLARAILAQQVARCLKTVVAGYRLPHPRLRERAVGLLSAALDCSATTVERLEREGTVEQRDFSGLDVNWPLELVAIFVVAEEDARERAACRREQERWAFASQGRATREENELYRRHHDSYCRGDLEEVDRIEEAFREAAP